MTRSRVNKWPDIAMALALLTLGVLLCSLGTGLLGQWQESAARHQDTPVGLLLAAAASAAGIGLLLWWSVSLIAAGAAVLLERQGRRRAAAAARRVSPVFMQRAVVAALSIQLVTGVAAHAATTTPGPEWTPTQAHAAPASASPAVPERAAVEGGDPSSPAAQMSAPSASRLAPAATPDSTVAAPEPGRQPPAAALVPGWQPAPPVVEPGLLTGPKTRPAAPERGGRATAVTVLAGDTLWDIVATYLGPEASDVDIALEWPRWYAANRGLIGGSPDVLLPGQILQSPAGL